MAIIGNSLKSIYARISELDESKKVFSDLGLSMRNANGEAKSSQELLATLAGKWNDLTDEEKRNASVKIAGMHQLSRFNALMNNWQEGIKATNTALNSQGSATRENDKYLQSFEARINKLKNTFTELSSAVGEAFLSDAMIGIFSLFENLLKLGVKLAGTFGVLPTVFVPLGLVFSKFGMLKTVNQNFERFIQNTQAYQNISSGLKDTSLGKSIGSNAVNKGLKNGSLKEIAYEEAENLIANQQLIQSEKTLQELYKNKGNVLVKVSKATADSTTATMTLTTASEVATGATTAFASALRGILISTGIGIAIAGVGFALEKLASAYANHKREQEKIEKQNAKMVDSYNKYGNSLDSMIARYKQLDKAKGSLSSESEKEYLGLINKLSDSFPVFLDYVDSNGKKHLKSAESMQLYVDILKEKIKLEAGNKERKAEVNLDKSLEGIDKAQNTYGKMSEYIGLLKTAREQIAKTGSFDFNGQILSGKSKEGKNALKSWEDQLSQIKVGTVEAITKWKKDLSESVSAELMHSGDWFNLDSKGQFFVNNLISTYTKSFEKDELSGKEVDWSKVQADLQDKATKLGEAMSKFVETSTKGYSEENKNAFMQQFDNLISNLPEEVSNKLANLDKSKIEKAFKDLMSMQGKVKGYKGDDIKGFTDGLAKSISYLIPDTTQAKEVIFAYAKQTENMAIQQSLAKEGIDDTTASIDENTNSVKDNTDSLMENVDMLEVMIGKTSDQVTNLENAVAIVRMFGDGAGLAGKQAEAYNNAIALLGSTFPYFTGSVLENMGAISASVGVMSAMKGAYSDLANIIATSSDAQQVATALSLQKKVNTWNQEISGLQQLEKAYDTLTQKIIDSDYVMTGWQSNRLTQLKGQIEAKKISVGKIDTSSILSQINSFKKSVSSSSGSGSSSSSPLADLFKIDTLERQHKAYEDIINSLSSKLQSLNKNSVAYRNTLKSIIDYELKNMALEKQQIAQKEARNIAIQRRLSALGNTSRHTKAQRDEYNDLQKEYEDNLSNISSLSKSIQDTLNEIKDKSLEIFTDFIDEIVTNYETAVKKIQDSIDNTEFKIDVHGYINADNLQELLNLQIQKAVDAQKVEKSKQDEVNTLNTEYNNAVAKYGKDSEQAKTALEALTNATEELEDAMIGVLDAEKDIVDTRLSIADESIETLKNYYQEMEDLQLESLDRQQDALEKAHEEKMKSYDDEIDKINEVYDTKIKNMDRKKEEDDYQSDLNDKNDKKAKLMNKIALLSKDDSRSGKKALAEAQDELKDLNKDINEMQSDHAFDKTKELIGDQKDNAIDAIEDKKTVEDEFYNTSMEHIENQKKAIQTQFENMSKNETLFAKLRDEALKGNFGTLSKLLGQAKIDLTKVGAENVDVTNLLIDVNKAINDLNSGKTSNKYTPVGGTYGNIAKPTTNKTTYVPPVPVSNPVQQPKPVQQQPTVVYYPSTSYGGSSIVDALKSIGIPSDMATRTKIASKNGISRYSGTASQNLQLLSLLKQGRLARFKSGGYVGSWTGDFGKLAMVDSGELILKEKDTSNLFDILDLMNKNILPMIKQMNLAKDFVNSGKANAITNNTTLNINIEKITGDKDAGNTILSTIIKGMKKLGK